MTRILLLCSFVASATSVSPCAKKSCVRISSRKVLKEEDSLSFGGVELSRRERLLQSSILAPIKAEELLTYDGVSNNQSDLFRFIRKMPKGMVDIQDRVRCMAVTNGRGRGRGQLSPPENCKVKFYYIDICKFPRF